MPTSALFQFRRKQEIFDNPSRWADVGIGPYGHLCHQFRTEVFFRPVFM